jgi:hypothetical protein
MEKKIVNAIIKVLRKRPEFNDWWENLDADSKNEITIELVSIIQTLKK